MNKINYKLAAIVCLYLVAISCTKEDVRKNHCTEATVIGKFGSAGGGVALSLSSPAFNAEASRTIFNDQQIYTNVVEAFGLDEKYNVVGTTIYFTARLATDIDLAGFPPSSADGLPAKSSIVIIDITNKNCEVERMK
ncbi:MAG: hypothetical protein LW821_04630 [Flammeovirgaceae bacterium]|nr:hypothetical protein [Flammeovirgaceae bacterium]